MTFFTAFAVHLKPFIALEVHQGVLRLRAELAVRAVVGQLIAQV